MALTQTGKDLTVLIVTEGGQDWQTFATWYSFSKNVPHAKFVIACSRNQQTPFLYFQWAKRLNIRTFYQKPFSENKELSQLVLLLDAVSHGLLGEITMVVPALTMAIDVLDVNLVNTVNTEDSLFWPDQDVWVMKNITQAKVEEMINRCVLENISLADLQQTKVTLIQEAKEFKDMWPLVTYKKGCGKWIHTLKGCPLSNAGGLIAEDMTVNENRIFDLWKRMVALYSAVAY